MSGYMTVDEVQLGRKVLRKVIIYIPASHKWCGDILVTSVHDVQSSHNSS